MKGFILFIGLIIIMFDKIKFRLAVLSFHWINLHMPRRYKADTADELKEDLKYARRPEDSDWEGRNGCIYKIKSVE